ncbi:MAG: tetratricopeptide repeat protein [Planctomycetes bacterium]|nr:tetratricopeptide repeat protein [Planctomycetota bacterium]
MAGALHERGEHAAAAKELRQLASQEGLAADLRAAALELLVFAELRAGDLDGAAESCARLREASPNGQKLLDAARAAAQALAKGGRAAEADALLASLDGAGAELCAAARIERAYISLEQGDPDAAEAHLSQALACAPEDPRLAEAAFFVAEALYERAEDARAVPLYEIAAKTPGGPAADRALYKGGFARMREGDAAGAAGSFARLAEEHPTSPLFGESLYLQGEMLYRLDRLDEAIACFERLRRASPGHEAMAKTLFRLGLAHCRDARWQEGEEALTELARRFPEFENGAEAELWRGRALSARGNARGARQALERVIARDRGVLAAQARIELGRLHGLAGDTEKALAEFLKVAVLFGGEAEVAEALFLAGQCLEKLGDADRARGQYQEIVQKHPQSPFAAQARARLDELKTF